MNLFEFANKDADFTGMTWDDANAMFSEGVEVSEASLNVHLDNLQDYLAQLVLSGQMSEEVIMQLAMLETEVFKAIYQHARLQTVSVTSATLAAKMQEWAAEAENSAKEGA